MLLSSERSVKYILYLGAVHLGGAPLRGASISILGAEYFGGSALGWGQYFGGSALRWGNSMGHRNAVPPGAPECSAPKSSLAPDLAPFSRRYSGGEGLGMRGRKESAIRMKACFRERLQFQRFPRDPFPPAITTAGVHCPQHPAPSTPSTWPQHLAPSTC